MSDSITWTNERRRLRDLEPWEHNPREIDEAEGKRLIESLDTFGQIQTIAVGPNGEIYDGHQRRYVWAASAKFGPDYEVDVRVASRPLTEQERQKLVVFLHRGTVGQWDWEELASSFEVSDLLEWGFSEAELQLDWGQDEPTPDPGAQIDKAAELQEKWQVQRGDVWEIPSQSVPGRCHRVMCGDSTDEADVGRLMGGIKARASITDPPYGVTGEEWDRLFLQSDLDMLLRNSEGSVVAFNAARPDCLLQVLSLEPLAERIYIWHNTFTLTHSEGAFWQWQPMFVWRRESFRGLERDVVQETANTESPKQYHPTQKSPSLLRRLVEASTDTGQCILDSFLGSGTTLVACEQTARIGYGMEIEPKYVSVTLQRLAGMGLEPRLVE